MAFGGYFIMNSQIEKYQGFKAELAIAETFAEIKLIESKAAAVAEFGKRDKVGLTEQNQWGKFRIKIEAKKGAWLDEKFPHGGDKKASSADTNLKKEGITPDESSNARLVARESELVNKIMADIETKNKVITPSAVASELRKKQKEILREEKAAEGKKIKLPQTIDLRLGDFKKVLADIPDNSIDLLLTDPPYPLEFIDCWSELSAFAEKKLKPSGFLIAYSGQMNLPEVLKRLSENLIYYWTFCLYHVGPTQIVNGVNVICRWKPILIYQKTPRKKFEQTKQDYIESETRQKSGHDWQQGESAIKKLIELFSIEGDLICDPFTGAGTVPKMCKETNRNFKGAEIEPLTFNIAKANIK